MNPKTALLIFSFALSTLALNSSAVREKSPRQGTAGDIEYRLVPVRDTGIQFPRVTAYKDAGTMNRVNAQIDEVSREFGCSEPRGKDDSYKVSSRVEYAARDIFSIYASASYYCGGPYPTNDENLSLTFDLGTGKRVEFAELFQNYEANKDPILKIIFAKQLARTARLLAAGKKSDENSNCEEDPDLFTLKGLRDSTFAYNFSEKGLVVQPQWPHVVEACAERVTVPYQQLKKFAAPKGILARVIP
ncbi:MAG: hypothetical protein DMG35_08880 [Acidobacteria bacterium]|nr:MAG: hypothetical protein DMG35_08880 [Acidobacteriota bacterium]